MKRVISRLGHGEALWMTVLPSSLFSPDLTGWAGVFLFLHFINPALFLVWSPLDSIRTCKTCACSFPVLEVHTSCSTCPLQAGCCVDKNSGETCTGICHLLCISSDCWLHHYMLINFSTFYLKHALSKPALHLMLLTMHFHHQITSKLSFVLGFLPTSEDSSVSSFKKLQALSKVLLPLPGKLIHSFWSSYSCLYTTKHIFWIPFSEALEGLAEMYEAGMVLPNWQKEQSPSSSQSKRERLEKSRCGILPLVVTPSSYPIFWKQHWWWWGPSGAARPLCQCSPVRQDRHRHLHQSLLRPEPTELSLCSRPQVTDIKLSSALTQHLETPTSWDPSPSSPPISLLPLSSLVKLQG